MTSYKKIYIFKRFERFWHWSQALLIIIMGLTGFEVHGTYQLFGYENATDIHSTTAWILITLWIFAVFWHITTGEWKQYIPTTDKMLEMVKYYSVGIFLNFQHPFQQTQVTKHNPLQRVAYLGFKLLIAPMIWISGLLYITYNDWALWGLDFLDLRIVALFHLAGAFFLLIFFVVHVYLTTTGHTLTSHVRAMITGWEEVEVDEKKSD